MMLHVRMEAGFHRVVTAGDRLHEQETPSDDQGQQVDEPHDGGREYIERQKRWRV
jgi:hypothetical protein